MKFLVIAIVFSASLNAFATVPYTYVTKKCDYKRQQEVNESVADYILANNTFRDETPVLRSAVKLEAVDRSWQLRGAALLMVAPSGTEVTGFHICTENTKNPKLNFSHEYFQLDENLLVKQVIEKGEVTLDLDHSVYMGDEHLAVQGSTLTAKASENEDSSNLVDITISLTLNVCDLTELTEEEAESESDCETVHEQVTADFKMTLPKKLSL